MSVFGPLGKRPRQEKEEYVTIRRTPLQEMAQIYHSRGDGATIELVLKRHEPSLAPKPVERVKLLVRDLLFRRDAAQEPTLYVRAKVTEAKAAPEEGGDPYEVGDIISFEVKESGTTLDTMKRKARVYDRVKLKRVTPRDPHDDPKSHWEDGKLTMDLDEEEIDVVHVPPRPRAQKR